VGAERPEYRRAPQRGEHSEEVLSGLLGYSRERIAELAGEGAFGAGHDDHR
jgi:hypothetical protein